MAKKVYKRNFITRALLRIDFNNTVNLTSDILKKFKEKLAFTDLEFKEGTVKRLELKVDKEDQSFSVMNIGKSGTYKFDKGSAKFTLDHEKFLLLVNKYERFSSFYEKFKTGFSVMQDLIKINEFKRIGLRYINTISLDEVKELSDWKKFIKPDIVPNYAKIKIGNSKFSLRRNMNRFVFGDGEFFVNIHSGIWNKNYPSKLTNKECILDIDCYVDNVILESEDILSKPREMDKIAFKYFEFLITSKLRVILEEK